MSKREKLRNHPKGHTKQEVETLLGYFDFSLDRISGSHHVFVLKMENNLRRIVIPMYGQQVKPAYVKLVVELIDELFPTEIIEDSEVPSDDE